MYFLNMSYQRSNGSSTNFGLSLSQSLFIDVSPLISISQLALGLTELGQVKGSNLLSLLNLLLVAPDLALQLVNEGLHALIVLPVLLLAIG